MKPPLKRAAMRIAALCFAFHAASAAAKPAEDVLFGWNKLVLELVRHTPTYSPPVASRAFAYLGITAFEAEASVSRDLVSLAGQVNGLDALPAAADGLDEAVVLNAALSEAALALFSNTGPTGQRAMKAMQAKLKAEAAEGVDQAVAAASQAQGQAIASHILAWAASDGGAVIENLGFPETYALTPGPAHWVPTNLTALQQTPLLPGWGKVRTFAMPDGAACPLPPPPEYSEDKASEFYRQASEVVDVTGALTPEQKLIARFWSDDAMLSPTPPGHWVSIAMQILERDEAGAPRSAEVLAKLGMAVADAFIGCWNAKFQYDLLRPVTYIRRVIDPEWEPMLNTPPFPEYPSGHSTQSGAAASIMTELFGENFAFDDATHAKDGMPARHFASFQAAADEAAVSRLYGGIHFRAAIDRGIDQGRCIAAHVIALRTRR